MSRMCGRSAGLIELLVCGQQGCWLRRYVMGQLHFGLFICGSLATPPREAQCSGPADSLPFLSHLSRELTTHLILFFFFSTTWIRLRPVSTSIGAPVTFRFVVSENSESISFRVFFSWVIYISLYLHILLFALNLRFSQPWHEEYLLRGYDAV